MIYNVHDIYRKGKARIGNFVCSRSNVGLSFSSDKSWSYRGFQLKLFGSPYGSSYSAYNILWSCGRLHSSQLEIQQVDE